MEQASRDRSKRQVATQRKMDEIERRLKHVAFAIMDWKLRYAIPKLTEVAAMFPNSTPIAKEASTDAVSFALPPTEDMPVEARVSIAMAPDPAAEKVRVTVGVLMMPVHTGYERDGWIDLLVQAPDTKKLEEFLDDRLVQFVQDYLRVRDPASPSQAERVAVDPVCQMTIPIVDAVSTVDYKEHKYYFCVDACRRKFEAAPGRYVKVVEKREW